MPDAYMPIKNIDIQCFLVQLGHVLANHNAEIIATDYGYLKAYLGHGKEKIEIVFEYDYCSHRANMEVCDNMIKSLETE